MVAQGSTAAFRRSTRCSASACVEVGMANGDVLVRDSKSDRGPTLAFTAEEFAAFVDGVKAGEFDDFCM